MGKLLNVVFFMWLLCLISCKKDEGAIIPSDVQQYYNNFISEADSRGVKINQHKCLHKIILQGPISKKQNKEGSTCAGYYEHGKKIIVIDTTHWAWKENPEFVLFHELGHAILKRGHSNDYLCSDNTCPKSIMNCCDYPLINSYTIYKKQYYFDELFNESTSRPYWATCH